MCGSRVQSHLGHSCRYCSPTLTGPINSIKATNTLYSDQQLKIVRHSRLRKQNKTKNSLIPIVLYRYGASQYRLAKIKTWRKSLLTFRFNVLFFVLKVKKWTFLFGIGQKTKRKSHCACLARQNSFYDEIKNKNVRSCRTYM